MDPSMTANTVATAVSELMESGAFLCTICGDSMRKLWSCSGHCYFACPHCQFVRVAPVPRKEVLRDYYDKAYEVDREGYRKSLRRYGHQDLEFLERLIDGNGRILEIGCSWGFFLDVASKRGWRVQGIELSPTAVRWAVDNLGLRVTCGTVEDSLLTEETSFDVVVAWHVIEHVQDPISFLNIVRDRLRPGGLLALRTPNIRSVSARLNGRAWQWVGAPAHLSLFSLKSLRLAVNQAGFSVRHVATRRGDAYNPVFELLRSGALRADFHRHIKRFLKLQRKYGADANAVDESLTVSRRARILGKLSALFDVAFFPLYPIERLFEFAGGGPELFLVAERMD
jgi:2-polyprenyl-3-methyl-5-hydroxy-6-metoxy-1,4-benzoquinol methylase